MGLTSGVFTLAFGGDDPLARVDYGTTRTFFAVVEFTADAAAQSPDRIRVAHPGEPSGWAGLSGGAAENRDFDLPLSRAIAPDVVSGVVRVEFSEELALDDATTDPENYTFTGGGVALAVTSVTLVSTTTADLAVNEMTDGAAYTVHVDAGTSGPTDLVALHVDPLANSAPFNGRGLRPVGVVSINNDAEWTNSNAVVLQLFGADLGAGVAEMQCGSDGVSWDAWTTYATNMDWTLASGDGLKVVYARFRDGAENVSLATSDTINLDATPPVSLVIGPASGSVITQPNFTLEWIRDDGAGAGVDVVELVYRKDGGTTATVPGGPFAAGATTAPFDASTLGNGVYEFHSLATDRVGHRESKSAFAVSITVTLPPPSPLAARRHWMLYQ